MTSTRRSRRLFSARANPWTWEAILMEMLGALGVSWTRQVVVASLSDGWEDITVGISGVLGVSWTRQNAVGSLSDGWEDVAVGISGDLGAPGKTDAASSNDRWEDVGVGTLECVRASWRRDVRCRGDVAVGISEGISGASWIKEVAVKRLVVGCISRDSWIREIGVKRLIVVWEELLGDWRIGSTPWRRLDVAEGLTAVSYTHLRAHET